MLRRLVLGRSDRKYTRALSYGSVIGIAAAVVLASACGGDDDDASATTGGGSNTGGTAADDDDDSASTGGSGTGGDDATGGADTGTGGAGAADAVVGNFVVTLVTGTANATSVGGRVRNAPILLDSSGYVWSLVDETDECQLAKPESTYCEPECTAPKKCVGINLCAEDPVEQDVGVVTMSGLKLEDGTTEFTMKVLSDKAKNYTTGKSFEWPPCTAGDELSLASEGGAYDSFTVKTKCIEPLVMTAAGDSVPLEKGKATELTWQAPTNPNDSKIMIEVDISHHGGQTGQINCEVPDTGSFTLPEKLTTQLITLGYAGFPDIALTRVATGSTSIAPGKVELSMVSNTSLPVTIPGLTSCNGDDTDCTGGQKCDTARMICATECAADTDCTDATCNTTTKFCKQSSK